MWVLLGVVALALLLPSLWPNEAGEQLSYTEFMAQVREGNVDSVVINNSTGSIEGEFDDASPAAPPAESASEKMRRILGQGRAGS